MSTPAWTKGPWQVDEQDNRIIGGDARATIVCSFHGSMRNSSVRADVHLIAAAPELYSALSLLLSECERASWPLLAEHMAVLMQARAALAKACGDG